jgi:transposase
MMTKRKTYTKEFKLEAVRLFEAGDKDGASLARELGIRRKQLYKWQKELQDKGSEAFGGAGRRPASKDGELARLRRENARLQEENEILKKAAACFARDLK